MVRIYFQSIHIDDIAETSSVNKGTNLIIGRNHTLKRNQGLGELNGEHNAATDGTHVVLDEDTHDVEHPKRKS
ncbi:hypothetical protein [Paenibacillus sedimenti]|uniref:Uncharacterized protein n=1 Tax=Paenibacillus sedimenti TaxID=2770274 RepID=A0A926KN41_9BACL|nr:hypothetical protein [Paenibacillus sedimenti]MBD0379821.1 hypothetical protein [Paenibacillus sedimenti]